MIAGETGRQQNAAQLGVADIVLEVDPFAVLLRLQREAADLGGQHLGLFTADNPVTTPPKGDKEEWVKLCQKLVAEAKAAQKAEGKVQIKSANCKACHEKFKG